MKRLGSSDSSGALITICPSSADEESPRKSNLYGREFQSMLEGLEEEGCVEDVGYHSEKKRRLRVDQVKALEKNFEVENKLEPERKVKLAQELGLQPRQVAVWFQNRRARWKTKQLERDYCVLKANYEALKLNYDSLIQDNEALHKQIEELKSTGTGSGAVSVKEEQIITTMELGISKSAEEESNKDHRHNVVNGDGDGNGVGDASLFSSSLDIKDGGGCCDSDSSAILNDDNCCSRKTAAFCDHQFLFSSPDPDDKDESSDSPSYSSFNCFEFQKVQQQYVKMEEQNFLSADEACNFFSDEPPPTLHWYSQHQWS